jgi:hypothetical protein
MRATKDAKNNEAMGQETYRESKTFFQQMRDFWIEEPTKLKRERPAMVNGIWLMNPG